MAIPSRVTAVLDGHARVECFGVERDVSTALMSEPVAVGDYVLVRSGRYVVEMVDQDEALESLLLMEHLLLGSEGGGPGVQPLGLVATREVSS